MKYDELKMFPYPVLRPESEDYLDSAFQATVQYELTKKSSTVSIQARFSCSEDAILELIEGGAAAYSLLVDSRETFFREVITSTEETVSCQFSGGKLKGKVSVSPFILAIKDIKDFKSKGFNADYAERMFNLVNGDVLALDRPREFYVGQEVFAHIGTVFELVESDEPEEGEIRLNLECDKIQILVKPSLKTKIDQARGQIKNRPILMSGVYMPALMQVLSYMAQGGEEFEDKKWYRAIKAKCDQKEIQLDVDINTLTASQILLDFPVNVLGKHVF